MLLKFYRCMQHVRQEIQNVHLIELVSRMSIFISIFCCELLKLLRFIYWSE